MGTLQFTEESVSLNRNPAEISEGKTEETPSELIMGNRFYVDSVFEQVFGNPSGDIYFQPEFGGKCDQNISPFVIDNKVEFQKTRCFGNLNKDIHPVSSAMRYSTTMKRCEAVIFNDILFSKAMAKVFTDWKPKSMDAKFKPTPESIKLAYDLFYQSEEPSKEVIDALLIVAETKTTINEQWQHIFLTLCISPGWQAI